MADPNTRQGKRTPVTLKIKFKSETLEQFIERYAVDVSQGGIFIRTKEPLAVGTQMRFEFQLRDASPLIAGEGTVVWTRENDPSRPAIAPGMGVRFDRLAEGSQGVLERILAEKAKQAPQRGTTETTKPPMFTDTPTRVAPAPVQEALLGNESGGSGPKRKRPDSFGDQGTPLPRPMPFHSDADEFPEEAFEEATKVRALDELIAQTADGAGGASTSTATNAIADELAARRGGRADSTLADPPRAETADPVKPPQQVDRDSAPGLPSPPEANQPKVLDAPGARAESRPSQPPANQANPDGLKTKLGMEPARIPLRPSTPTQPPATSPAPQRPVAKDAPTKPTGMRAVAAEPKVPEAPKKSGAPIVLLLLLLVAAGGAAVWFLVIRPKADDTTTTSPKPGSNGPGSAGSALATGPGSAGSATPTNGSNGSDGSAGSAVANNGGGSAGSATPENGSAGSATAPAAELVETVISAPGIDKATIEVAGTDQTGAAPLKAKLEKGKAYKARVQAPGYLAKEVDVNGGEKASAKLDPKPRIVTVSSDPPGALIFVDGGATGHSTPFDLELTKAQAAKKSVRVAIRKAGWKQVERVIDAGKYTEDADKMIAKLDEKLDKQVIVQNPNPNPGNTVKTGTGSGSASTANGSAGSGATQGSAGSEPGGGTDTPKPPGGGTGDAPKPPGGEGSASGQSLKDTPKEPEPDFVKPSP